MSAATGKFARAFAVVLGAWLALSGITRPDQLQAESDGEILSIGRSGDHDGIAGVSQRDTMPDGLASGLR